VSRGSTSNATPASRGTRRSATRPNGRATPHSWSFQQLGGHVAYKATRAGVPVELTDPAYLSQRCATCGHIDRNNLPNQATFGCTSRGVAAHADVKAAAPSPSAALRAGQ
jgi:hypothetical protein